VPGPESKTIRLRAWIGLLIILAFGCVSGPAGRTDAPLAWAAYYSAEPVDLSRFALVILDSEHHPPLGPRPRPLTLAYLSLGEVGTFRPYFDAVQREGLLAGVNPNWDSHFIDLRDPRWAARVLEELLPAIIVQGFDGVLLDTLDSAIYLEEQDPQQFRGMQDAAVRLVNNIRAKYPGLLIAMNRAYPLLPRVEQSLDYELAESVYGSYDFERKAYKPVHRADTLSQLVALREARERRPELEILTLDYWNPEDSRGIKRIYRKQKAHGFHPYVATIKLDRIIAEAVRPGRIPAPRTALSRPLAPPPQAQP